MKTKELFKIMLGSLLMTLTLTACSNGMDAASTATDGSNNGQGNGGQNTTALDSVDLNGYSSGGDSEGRLVMQLDKVNKALIISVPIAQIGLDINVNASLSQFPDIQVYSYTDTSKMNHLAVRVPLKYLLRGINLGNPQILPNGEAIPFQGGEMPSISLVINAVSSAKAYLYLGSGAVVVYVSHPKVPATGISLLVPVKNQAGTKVLGQVGVMTKTAKGDGGFLVSTKIPAEAAKILDDYIGSY